MQYYIFWREGFQTAPSAELWSKYMKLSSGFCHSSVDFHAHSCRYKRPFPHTPIHTDAQILTGEWQKPIFLMFINMSPISFLDWKERQIVMDRLRLIGKLKAKMVELSFHLLSVPRMNVTASVRCISRPKPSTRNQTNITKSVIIIYVECSMRRRLMLQTPKMLRWLQLRNSWSKKGCCCYKWRHGVCAGWQDSGDGSMSDGRKCFVRHELWVVTPNYLNIITKQQIETES